MKYVEVWFSIKGDKILSAAGGGKTLVEFLEENSLEIVCVLGPTVLLAKKKS